MRKYHYELNCGQYVLHLDGAPIQKPMDEFAVCLDTGSETGVRHKFGNPESVHAWHQQARKSFIDMGAHQIADDLVVIQGRFTLDDIHKVIENSAGAMELYKKVRNGTAQSLDLFGNIIEPSNSPLVDLFNNRL